MENKHGILYTFGDSQASVNLIGSILTREEFKEFRPKVFRILTKQIQSLKSLMDIYDKNTRETSLKMWHDNFSLKILNLPDVIQTHMCCIETGFYRELLNLSRRNKCWGNKK